LRLHLIFSVIGVTVPLGALPAPATAPAGNRRPRNTFDCELADTAEMPCDLCGGTLLSVFLVTTYGSLNLIIALAPAVVERIELEISGFSRARLPTEQELMTAMGVSRTVVREAIAALRSRGFAVTRRRAGAFVNADASKRPYVINPEALGSLRQVIEVLDLRMAVEVEKAALSSRRASLMQIKAIRLAQHAFGQAIERGKRGIT
jgi:hypothetical protein